MQQEKARQRKHAINHAHDIINQFFSSTAQLIKSHHRKLRISVTPFSKQYTVQIQVYV